MIVPVILCGGSGGRLWPVSRESCPKQFQRISGQKHSLFQCALNRVQSIPGASGAVVVCNEDHRVTVSTQIEGVAAAVDEIILEQTGRNTLPAVANAAFSRAPDDLLLILPSDHYIRDAEGFSNTVQNAVPCAQDGMLVCFGSAPDNPKSGYRYIIPGREREDRYPGKGVRSVKKFMENSDYESAAFIIDEGAFCSSGMFLFRAATILEEIRRYHPGIYHYCREARRCSKRHGRFSTMNAELLRQCPSISLDDGVMKQALDAVVVNLQCDWSDIGSWESVHESLKEPSRGNTLRGDVMTDNVKNSCVISNNRLVAAIGLDNHIIVETADAVLVARRDHVEQVKDMVGTLKDKNRPEASNQRKVQRSWGYIECLEATASVQVKRLVIDPGARLSIKRLKSRSKYWVVVRGNGKVVSGKHRFDLAPSQAAFTPPNTMHQLENAGPEPLEIIEVQTMTGPGEDDFERFEYDYVNLGAETPPLRAVS